MNKEQKDEFDDLIKNGDLEDLYRKLLPLIQREEPYALYLYSCFSLPKFQETDEEFDKRSIELKIKASERGIAEASYRMGVNYLYGNDVTKDLNKASEYFERAITQGHSYTKYTFGYSLYYGTDGVGGNEERGLALIKEAANEGIKPAVEVLENINNKP